jgi:release factor glutamine methyltransferase
MDKENLKNYLLEGREILKSSNIQTYSIDTQVLLMEITGLNKVQLLTKDDFILNESMIKKFKDFFEKRSNHMPVSYITNHCEFMSLDFYVDQNVLIPRQDTETLVETAIDYIKKYNVKNILEIGTGSGCIPVSLAYYVKGLNITSVDISKEALKIAKKNATKNNVDITFIQSDLFKNLNKNIKYDLIISNPPYIKPSVIKTLEASVKHYEPIIALDGYEDGLYFYKNIITHSLEFLKLYGIILFEIGYDQKDDVIQLLKPNFKNIKSIKDLAKLDRVVLGLKK